MKRKMVLFSGGQSIKGALYYHFCQDWLLEYLKKNLRPKAKVVFIAWALWGSYSADQMFNFAVEHWGRFGLKLIALHQQKNYFKAIKSADAIIVGGGSLHVLVKELEQVGLMPAIKDKIESGCLYIGTSAGSVITGPTMHTANEPPMIHIPSHKTLGILPFQLSAHYYDHDPDEFHHGPPPPVRVKNYLQLNPKPCPVVCLRDGGYLLVEGNDITVMGKPATVFDLCLRRFDFEPGDHLNELLSTDSRYYFPPNDPRSWVEDEDFKISKN